MKEKTIRLNKFVPNGDYLLNPSWVSGFVDGEGCFTCSIIEDKNYKLGWRVKPIIIIAVHVKDKHLIEAIKKSFGVGHVTRQGPSRVQLRVETLTELETVINHFEKYPLITKKRADYIFLKMVIKKMKRKGHLTYEGLCQIVALKAAMNLGLPGKLKKAFPDVVPVERPNVELPQTIHPDWLSGFTSAEGCFYLRVSPSKLIINPRVELVYLLTQHGRDKNLMITIKDFLNCGHVYENRTWINYRVTKFDDIDNKIIPFFKKYMIRGVKSLDFYDWSQARELMKEKKHLTPEGLELIRKIKAGMKRGR